MWNVAFVVPHSCLSLAAQCIVPHMPNGNLHPVGHGGDLPALPPAKFGGCLRRWWRVSSFGGRRGLRRRRGHRQRARRGACGGGRLIGRRGCRRPHIPAYHLLYHAMSFLVCLLEVGFVLPLRGPIMNSDCPVAPHGERIVVLGVEHSTVDTNAKRRW